MEGFKKYCKEGPLLFLLNQKYSFYSLELGSFKKEGVEKYYVKQRYGGPTIDFFTPIFGERENNTIGPGFLSIHPSYYHKKIEFVPNEDLKSYYRLLTSFIRKMEKK